MWVIVGMIWISFLIVRTISSAELNRITGLGHREGGVHKLWRIGLWQLAVVPLLYVVAYKLTGRKRPGIPNYKAIEQLERDVQPGRPWQPFHGDLEWLYIGLEEYERHKAKPTRLIPVTTAPAAIAATTEEIRQRERGPARGAPFTPPYGCLPLSRRRIW